MPFVFDYSQISLPLDSDEMPLPGLAQFQYLKPPQIGGAPDPVRFRDPSTAPVPSSGPPARSFMQRLFGGAPASPALVRQEMDAADRMQRFLAIVLPALRRAGVRRLYGRYDGGNDEGFSWMDSVELRDGRQIECKDFLPQLVDTGVLAELAKDGTFKHWRADAPPVEHAKGLLDDWLSQEWAVMLLGRGFGTGEFQMYGAFTVDLDTCLITDDPKAEAVVQNIAIGD